MVSIFCHVTLISVGLGDYLILVLVEMDFDLIWRGMSLPNIGLGWYGSWSYLTLVCICLV